MKQLSRGLISAAAVLACGLSGCSRSALPVPVATVSESQAQTDIEFRLNKTQELRAQISSLRSAIRPIESALKDIGKAADTQVLNARLDAKPGEAFATLLDRLEEALREALSGMVQPQPDGSWVLDRAAPDLCPAGRVRIVGQPVDSGQRLTAWLSDCTNPGNLVTIAQVTVRSDGAREVSISDATFPALQHASWRLDQCELEVDASGYASLSCAPMSLAVGPDFLDVSQLELSTDAQGTRAAIHASLSDPARGLLGTADVALVPGTPASVRVCARGQSCGG